MSDSQADPVGTRTVALYVRSLSDAVVQSHQRSVIERLHHLSAVDAIDGFEIEVWGKGMVLSASTARTESGRRFLAEFRRIRRWAEANDAAVEPFFEVREVSCELTDEAFTVVTFPVSTLVERRDGELVSVAPRTTAAGTTSVGDRLDELERATPADAPTDGTDRRDRRSRDGPAPADRA